jgi:hypothetical protein
MKLLLGVLLSNFITAIFFLFLFLFEYSGGAFYALAGIMAIGYLGSITLILGSIDKKCGQAYMDGYSDGDHSSRNIN